MISGGGGGGNSADFTIEWFQKVENNYQNSRPWSVGLYPTQILAVSYEGHSSDFFWVNNSSIGSVPTTHVGQGWEHMAIVRQSGVVNAYVNGSVYLSVPFTSLITDNTQELYVGTGEIAAGMFQGYLTNLHIMKGVAKYTGNFTPPSSPIVADLGSVFLMRTETELNRYDDMQGGKSALATGTPAWSSDSPFAASGPVTQATNSWSNSSLDFGGGNYNTDLLFVKKGWTVTDGSGRNGIVSGDATEIIPGVIRVPINFDPAGSGTWTFTQPSLGSVYFNSSNFLSYGASNDWAMDI